MGDGGLGDELNPNLKIKRALTEKTGLNMRSNPVFKFLTID
jgi:hypothetical protein